MALPASAAFGAAVESEDAQPVARVLVDWERDGLARDGNLISDPEFTRHGQDWGAVDGYATPQVSFTDPELTLSWDDTSTDPGGLGILDLVAPLAAGQAYQCRVVVNVPAGSPVVRWGDLNGDDWVSSSTNDTDEMLTVSVTAAADTVVGVFTAADPGTGSVLVTSPSITGPDGIDDLTSMVDEIEVVQAITTDLPDTTRLVAGEATSSATVVLRGDPVDNDRSAAALFSPYSTGSPYYALDRRAVPVRIELGYQVGDAPEALAVFEGVTDDLRVNGAADSATLPCVDGTGAMTGRPELPQVVGRDSNLLALMMPGLNSQWVIAELAAAAGYHAVPPPRPDCLLHASMLGSLACRAEFGVLTAAVYQQDNDADGTPDEAVGTTVPYEQDGAGFGLRPSLPDGTWYQATYTLAGDGIRQRSGDSWLIQAWIDVPAAANSWSLPEHSIAVADADEEWVIDLRLEVSGGTGAVTLRMTRDSVVTTVTPGIGQDLTEGRHYVAVYGHHGDNTSIATVWRVDSDTATATESGITSAAAAPFQTVAAVQGSTGSSALQVTAEYNGPDADPHVRWNDQFTPTAYLEAGLAELTAIPSTDATDAGELLREVVAAEYGTLIVGSRADPDTGEIQTGVLQFWNRRHWQQATEALTVQHTLTAADTILSMSTSEPARGLRNIVRVPLRPLYVLPAGRVWEYTGEPLRVPALGEVTTWADFGQDAVYQLDTTGSVIPSGGATASSGSGYRAARRADGTGGAVSDLTMTVEAFATTAKITVSNPHVFDVWLVSPTGAGFPSGSDGKNALQLVGRRITATAPSLDTDTQDAANAVSPTVEVRDAGSVSRHGEFEITLPQSPWRQSTAEAEELARDLLAALAEPAPQILDLEIIADPRVQLGDRVQIQDPPRAESAAPLHIDDPFWIVGLTTHYSAAGATMRAVLRPVARPGQWILGVAGRSELGITTTI